MKNYIFFGVFLCMVVGVLYSAEHKQLLTIHMGDTSFSIIRGNMYKYHKEVGCMVVGRNQQRTLQKPDMNDWVHTGKIDDEFGLNNIYFLSKNRTITENKNVYFGIKEKNEIWKVAQKKELQCSLIRIVEPRITFDPVCYYCSKDHPRRKNSFIYMAFYDDRALEEASKDLQICYKKSLKKGLDILKDKQEKKIALAALSTDMGLSEDKAVTATFKAIVEFIRENSEYRSIQLFVKRDSEFELYKELAENYLVEQK